MTTHDLDLTIGEEPARAACTIEIAPNFQRITSERTEATSVRLELLAWAKSVDEAP